VLVLSGATGPTDLKRGSDLKPDLVVSDVSELPSKLDGV